MMQSLYRVSNPDTEREVRTPEDLSEGEFRQIVLNRGEDRNTGILKVHQGWWNQAERKPVLSSVILEHTFVTWAEGESAYDAQIQFAVKDGYVYSFTIDPFSDTGYAMEYIGPEIPAQ